MITTNNARYPARIRFTRRDGSQGVLPTDRGNARRYMLDNLARVREACGRLAESGETEPMRKLFAGCKARVEVERYALGMGKPVWQK